MSEIRLLILDDDALTAATIENMAESVGVTARHTVSARAFFDELQGWEPTHVFLDLNMPDMDGVQVMNELARLGSRARIIIGSGVGDRVIAAAGRSATAHGLDVAGVLAKPFAPGDLRRLLLTPPADEPAPALAPTAATAPSRPAIHITPEDIQRGLEASEFRVVYQPKVECGSGSVAGFEALMRWQHPEYDLVPPMLFIPLAEEHGLIGALTEFVMGASLPWFAAWSTDRGASAAFTASATPTLSINISAKTLSDSELVERLEALCRQHDIEPSRLIFELTETSTMDDPVASLDLLTRLRTRGFQLSIDDFGTGYSSMVQLVRLPFSEIKVDKSFVITAGQSEESRKVIRSIIELGRSLGLKTTAEGIEDAWTLGFLRDLGCDLAQGYYIGRPMSAEQLIPWSQERRAHTEARRQADLRALGLVGSPPELRFDRITRLAQRLFDVPMAMISLMDEDHQWFKSAQGMAPEAVNRDITFCNHTIEHEGVTLVPDAARDPRFRDNPLVSGEPHLRFYAGYPLHVPSGSRIGTLSLLDTQPREMSREQIEILQELTRQVENELMSDRDTVLDASTGLMNRPAFESRAEDVLRLCERLHQPALLLLVEPRFDNAGATAGQSREREQLRVALAWLMRTALRESDLIARLDNDEFAALLVGAGPDHSRALMARFGRSIDRYNQRNEQGVRLTCRTGFARMLPGERKDVEGMLSEADVSLLHLPFASSDSSAAGH